MDRKKQHGSRSNAPRGGGEAAAPVAAAGRHGKGGGKAGGGKKPIKVVYISNPMRVKTSAEGFRALVQELTGRHADPSKYSPEDFGDGEGAAAREDPEEEPAGAGAGASSPQGSAGQDVAGAAVAPGQQPDFAAAFASGDDDDDIFRSQLLDTNYSVFSPPTLLYDHHPNSNKLSYC